jgi:hypothetical protein
MQRADSKSRHECMGKVAQVICENDLRLSFNRRRKNVAVIGIRQAQILDVMFIAVDYIVIDRLIHECASSFQVFAFSLRLILQDISDPLFVNLIGPARAKQSSIAKRKDQICHQN